MGERQLPAPDLRKLTAAGIAIATGQGITAVGQDLAVITGGRGPRFDAVILATGSAAISERLEGDRKQGVHPLESREAYSDLGARLRDYAKAVVYGSGPVAVDVAEKLRSRGVSVSLLAPGGILPFLNPGPRKVLLDSISSRGIAVSERKPEKVVGVDRVEAVIASGDVVPCDSFIIIPRLVPSVPKVSATLGRSGGIVVDGKMLSSTGGLYGAGDCAEMRFGPATLGVLFESSARLMGAVAGANAAGDSVSANVVGSFYKELVGVGVVASGLSLAEASGLGLDVSESSRSWRGELACSIVFEKTSGAALGVQLVGRSVERFAESIPLIVASRASLEQVAFQETVVSSDISPIAETAREGLRERRQRY